MRRGDGETGNNVLWKQRRKDSAVKYDDSISAIESAKDDIIARENSGVTTSQQILFKFQYINMSICQTVHFFNALFISILLYSLAFSSFLRNVTFAVRYVSFFLRCFLPVDEFKQVRAKSRHEYYWPLKKLLIALELRGMLVLRLPKTFRIRSTRASTLHFARFIRASFRASSPADRIRRAVERGRALRRDYIRVIPRRLKLNRRVCEV